MAQLEPADKLTTFKLFNSDYQFEWSPATSGPPHEHQWTGLLKQNKGIRVSPIPRLRFQPLHLRPARLLVRVLTLVTLLVAIGVGPAHAQTQDTKPSPLESAGAPVDTGLSDRSIDNPAVSSLSNLRALFMELPEPSAVLDVQPLIDDPSSRNTKRGRLFSTLEVSFFALQMLDTVSTMEAAHNGLIEANPIMRSLTARPAAFVAVKAATATGIAMLARELVHDNRVAAIIFVGAIDAAYSVVVARNFALLHAHPPR